MSRKLIALVGVGGLVGAFALGRFTAPHPQVEQRVEAKVDATKASAVVATTTTKQTKAPVRVRIVKHTVPTPAGPEITETREIDRGPVVTEEQGTTQTTTQEHVASETRTTTIIRTELPRWMLAVGAGTSAADLVKGKPTVFYGGDARYRFAGPFWAGLHADSRGDVMATLAVTF